MSLNRAQMILSVATRYQILGKSIWQHLDDFSGLCGTLYSEKSPEICGCKGSMIF